jgi:cytochrome c oxidase subunit 2
MIRRHAVPLLIAAVALIAGGCQAVSLRDPVTEQALQVRDLYNLVFAVAAFVFILVEGLIVWSVIRYRRKPTDTNLPVQTHGNLVLELIWTAIPMVTVLVLFIASWNVLNVVDTPASKSLFKDDVPRNIFEDNK